MGTTEQLAPERRDTTTGSIPVRMSAAVQQRYGTAEAVRVQQVEVPVPGRNEVVLQVHAAGVDRGVWHLMTGRPYLLRLFGFGLTRPRQPVLGMDLAGRVVAVGAGVTRFEVGEEVFGIGIGSFAQYARAREDKLVHRPAELHHIQAAAAAISGLTARQALHDAGRVQAGQRVLILGASGGVGSFAVQLARAAGAQVTGVCSGGKADLVRSLGADHVIDYATTDPTAGPERYDVILDIGGRTPVRRLRRALAPSGTLVIVGGENGGRWTGGVGRQLRAMALALVVRQRLTTFISKESRDGLEQLLAAITAGEVLPAVERVYPLAEAPQALLDLQEGRTRGKSVVAIPPAGTGPTPRRPWAPPTAT